MAFISSRATCTGTSKSLAPPIEAKYGVLFCAAIFPRPRSDPRRRRSLIEVARRHIRNRSSPLRGSLPAKFHLHNIHLLPLLLVFFLFFFCESLNPLELRRFNNVNTSFISCRRRKSDSISKIECARYAASKRAIRSHAASFSDLTYSRRPISCSRSREHRVIRTRETVLTNYAEFSSSRARRTLASPETMTIGEDAAARSGRARCEGATMIFLAAQQLTSLFCFTILEERARVFSAARFPFFLPYVPPGHRQIKSSDVPRTRCFVDHLASIRRPYSSACLLDTLPPRDALLAATRRFEDHCVST